MPGTTHPRRAIHLKRVKAAQQQLEKFSDLIGRPVVYRGAGKRELYPERIGCACRVVQISETDHICPLILEFKDSFRGIAEAEWLAEVIR